MLDDFFMRAIIGGVGVALIAGPLGCFVVWRRMAYFGDTMAHSALLGVAMSIFLEINTTIGVFAVAMAVALALLALMRQQTLSSDTLLGILSHSALALGLVAVAFMATARIDLLGYLFGDILAVSRTDIALIYVGGAIVLGMLMYLWRDLLAETVSPELAAAEGLDPQRARLVFVLLLAAVIAVAMKIVGIVLITALLIIPAAAARQLARTPETMAVLAAALGASTVLFGLYGSLSFDTPSGPSIVVAALLVFSLSWTMRLFLTRNSG